MKKVIITDLLILAVFGSTCFWSVKKDRLTALVDKILTEQTSEDEEILVLTSSNLAKKNGQIGETPCWRTSPNEWIVMLFMR